MSVEESRIVLPEHPAELGSRAVKGWREPVSIDTYEPADPDRYPAYLDQRVYQGSSGAVYPLPFIDRIAQEKQPRQWDAVHLENEYVRLMILPELGGRIHVGYDKTRGYDFFYRNDVIKPALVGLAGPWVSGGVEFNWPQHHRPATFLPTQATIEEEPDGAVTIWCSDHDPFTRMQGMHGVRLRPGSALVELRVRLVNRTDDVQTFLWWANVAVAVHDGYQSFFPTDVQVVADHAKRAVTTFPSASGRYYGVDYPEARTPRRQDGDRLDWYRNIPVPTSYMCLGSHDDFFGGYDHHAGAGVVHWADHRVAPGKKQWTWGHAEFGQAWDSHLTDSNGPYVELMAGVFTDNQPDFAFLRPGETKAFSQYWYPLHDTGPVHQANREAAVRLDVHQKSVRIGVAVTSKRAGVRVRLLVDGKTALETTADIEPGRPLVRRVRMRRLAPPHHCELVVEHDGLELLRWRPRPPSIPMLPTAATEPPAPEELASVDELYLTGLHLEQYRHATRSPEPYWREALRRDPGDARCHVALAARRQRDGLLDEAEQHLRSAVARLTLRNPNPRDGEAHYRLGQVLARRGDSAAAREAFGKAAWDEAWTVPATIASVRLDLSAGNVGRAAEAIDAVVARHPENAQARNLGTVAAMRAGHTSRARELVEGTLRINPMDAWARELATALGVTTVTPSDDPTVLLDVAVENLSIGWNPAASALLERVAAMPTRAGRTNVAPLAMLYLADLHLRHDERQAARILIERTHSMPRTWCFPSSRDADMLARLRDAWPCDEVVATLSGHWLYAAGRHQEAITAWTNAVASGSSDAVVLRNLGVAAYNINGDADAAAQWYAKARASAPDDARLLYEFDQLQGRRGVDPRTRLTVLLRRHDLVDKRDDLAVQLAELLTVTGDHEAALQMLAGRRFQPWEGGEGRVLAAWEEANLALYRRAMELDQPADAVNRARAALNPPASLGEARHPLANTASLHLALGDALAAGGELEDARVAWETAASQDGDFQDMRVQECSDRTAASVHALRRLGRAGEAQRLQHRLSDFAAQLAVTPAKIDFFATSLPTMLLFTDDLQARQDRRVLVIRAQLADLEGDRALATELAAQVLALDPLDSRARELMSSGVIVSAGTS